MAATEWYTNQRQIVDAEFRAYDSLNESIEDHNKLISNSRYSAVRESTEYKSACQSLYNCGYSTDPEYPEKLIKLIEDNKLYEFDSKNSLAEASVTTNDERILRFQRLCNKIGIRDSDGKTLV